MGAGKSYLLTLLSCFYFLVLFSFFSPPLGWAGDVCGKEWRQDSQTSREGAHTLHVVLSNRTDQGGEEEE